MKRAFIFAFVCVLFAAKGIAQADHHYVRFGTVDPALKNGKYVFPVLTAEQVMAAQGIGYGDAAYTVVGYDLSFAPFKEMYYGPFSINGAAFSPKVKEAMKNCGNKGQIFIDNIKVIGPDKKVRPIPAVAINYGH